MSLQTEGCWHTAPQTWPWVSVMRKHCGCASDAASRCELTEHALVQRLFRVLHAHSFPSTALQFGPASDLLLSTSADATVRVLRTVQPEASCTSAWPRKSVLLTEMCSLLFAAGHGARLRWCAPVGGQHCTSRLDRKQRRCPPQGYATSHQQRSRATRKVCNQVREQGQHLEYCAKQGGKV
jgi:hypothetical protein